MNVETHEADTQALDDRTRLAGRRVLVVDDEPDFAESLQDLLESDGCQVTLIADPADVNESLRDFDAEAILLDVRLKQANGMDLIGRLRSLWPEARIVIVTGFSSKDTAIEALKCGAFDYLEKPIRTEELEATLVRALWAHDADVRIRLLPAGRDGRKRHRVRIQRPRRPRGFVA